MCVIMCEPGGAIGLCMKLYSPCNAVCADIFGDMFDGRSKLRVRTSCGMRRHHRCIGKAGGRDDNPAMKWSLKVCMALSATFARWLCGGTN